MQENLFIQTLNNILQLMNFKSFELNFWPDIRRINLIINDEIINKKQIPVLITAFENIFNLIAKKFEQKNVVVDINFYRKERERLIIELAKAAAKKILTTKENVKLPPMNSYERRLIHTEISSHPDLKTESEGEGKNRCVVVKYIRNN